MGAGVWRAAHKVTAKGLKPPRQCSQPGSLNPGATLESDGMVKRLNTRKHRHQEQANEADQGLDQKGKRSGSGFLTWPDPNGAPPVYRVDLIRPVTNAEHGKAVHSSSRLGCSKASPPQGRPREDASRLMRLRAGVRTAVLIGRR